MYVYFFSLCVCVCFGHHNTMSRVVTQPPFPCGLPGEKNGRRSPLVSCSNPNKRSSLWLQDRLSDCWKFCVRKEYMNMQEQNKKKVGRQTTPLRKSSLMVWSKKCDSSCGLKEENSNPLLYLASHHFVGWTTGIRQYFCCLLYLEKNCYEIEILPLLQRFVLVFSLIRVGYEIWCIAIFIIKYHICNLAMEYAY